MNAGPDQRREGMANAESLTDTVGGGVAVPDRPGGAAVAVSPDSQAPVGDLNRASQP